MLESLMFYTSKLGWGKVCHMDGSTSTPSFGLFVDYV